VPFRWAGLSPTDRTLLEVYVERMARKPDAIHTHVAVGTIPVYHEDGDDPVIRAQLEACWPRRIDAVLRWGRKYQLVECKPDANHYVLGQLLCYVYWWLEHCHDLPEPQAVLVTDRCDPDVKPVVEALGVRVVEVGDISDRVNLA